MCYQKQTYAHINASKATKSGERRGKQWRLMGSRITLALMALQTPNQWGEPVCDERVRMRTVWMYGCGCECEHVCTNPLCRQANNICSRGPSQTSWTFPTSRLSQNDDPRKRLCRVRAVRGACDRACRVRSVQGPSEAIRNWTCVETMGVAASGTDE